MLNFISILMVPWEQGIITFQQSYEAALVSLTGSRDFYAVLERLYRATLVTSTFSLGLGGISTITIQRVILLQ